MSGCHMLCYSIFTTRQKSNVFSNVYLFTGVGGWGPHETSAYDANSQSQVTWLPSPTWDLNGDLIIQRLVGWSLTIRRSC